MATYLVPIVIYIEADSYDEAQKKASEWGDDTDLDDFPEGTSEVDFAPSVDHDDDGQRILTLHPEDLAEDDFDDDDEDEDDFADDAED